MTSSPPDYPCCVMLPYKATIYWDGYSQEEPYMTDSGRVYVEMMTNQVGMLEPGGAQYKRMRELVRQKAKENLEHDLIRSIERHEGIGGLTDWVLPLIAHPTMFVMFKSVKVVLRGTPMKWIHRQGGIFFTAKVQFCITADI